MKQIIAILTLSAILLSCGKTGTQSNSNVAATIIATAESTAPVAAGLATTAYLGSIKDKTKQKKAACLFYTGANGLYALSTGQNLTPDQIQQALLATMGADDPIATEIANLIVGFYSSIYPQFGIAGKSPTVLLGNIAQGVSNNAKSFCLTQ